MLSVVTIIVSIFSERQVIMKEYFKILKQKVKKTSAQVKKSKIMNSSVKKIKSLKNSKVTEYSKKGLTDTMSFGRKIYAKTCNWFNVYGTKLGKIGIKAHWISWIGFGIGVFAVNFLALEMYGWALIAILLNRICDGLDGAIARSTQITNFGVFLDASLDYIFYGGVIWGFALANNYNASSACFLMFGFTAAACAMLSYSVIAYKMNSQQSLNLDNSPFYLGGVAQGSETLVVLILLCLFPKAFVPLAVIFGILSLIKAFSVIVAAYYNFVIMAKK